ncbi:hypothetical protein WMY93_022357 [Mugilogobius chulae]|uniref:C-type lectin domain-containing protein n=1 Tax=Mugilogobius chulae TaxID=88201 RepID=A0AAW0N6Q6_9GOBI
MEVRRPDLEFLLLLLVFPAASWKYVYVPNRLTWKEAQRLCTTNYTDLAPVSNEHDQDFLTGMTATTQSRWFGLKWNTSSRIWDWSGGTKLSTAFWSGIAPTNPNNREYAAVMLYGQWHGYYALTNNFPFFCYKVHAIRERKTWYEALDYCRQNHQDLASVASETEMMLMEKELGKELSSQNVWIGLQYLVDEWLWLDGQTFGYESWGTDPTPICPSIDYACGALRLNGTFPFFCHKVHGISEWKTWYEALDYCRQNHQDLASVASETEMMLIGKELGKELSSQNVCIGLQFMVDKWLWMERQTLSYESWGPDPKPTC